MGNVIAFHGSDRKSGVSMTALSVSEELGRMHPDKTVLYLCLNCRCSADYFEGEVWFIQDMNLQVISRTLTVDEIKTRCRYEDNLYVLRGIRNPVDGREFIPDCAEYVLNLVKDEFDFIVCDTGSDLDDGLAMGALQRNCVRYMIISQSESGIRAYEKMGWLYKELDLTFDRIIINRYFPTDPYDVTYIAERLYRTKDMFHVVRTAGYCRQAEMEHKSLLRYRNDNYRTDIHELAEYISIQAGYKDSLERKRRLWRIGSI